MTAHFIDGCEPGADGVRGLIARALALEAGAAPRKIPNKRLISVFLNPSLRTRTSLEAACHMLGVAPIVLQPGTDAWALEFGEGAVMDGTTVEHVKDAVQVLSGYGHALAVRAFAGLKEAEADRADPILSAFCAHASVPILNLESARWHPLQGLADAATWTHHLGDDLAGKRLTLTWAPHPKALPTAVPNQVLLTASLLGMDVTIAHPEGMDLDPMVLARARVLAEQGGGQVRQTHDRGEAFTGAQVVVAKSWGGWSGYGDRRAEAVRRAGLAHWRVTPEDLWATDGAGFMHCLPIRRNVVATDGVLDGPASWVHETAHRRLWTVAAVIERMLGEGDAWSA